MNRVWWTIGAVAVLSLALGLSLAVGLQTDPRETRALHGDYTIIGATSGTESLVTGNRIQKALLRWLPSLQPRIGGGCFTAQGATPASLVVWESVKSVRAFSGLSGNPTVLLLGEHGERLRAEAARSVAFQEGPVAPWVISVFPRRGKTIRLRFDEHSLLGPQPDLLASNPVPGDYPHWEPGPTTLRSGPLVVTVKGLWTSLLSEDKSILDLRVRENGKPAGANWGVDRVTISDPTGNVWDHPAPYEPGSGERYQISELPALLRSEPVYRVRVELSRLNGFPPEDVHDFGAFEMPAKGHVVPVHRTTLIHGQKVELAELVGKDTESSYGWTSSGSNAAIRLFTEDRRYRLRTMADSETGPSPLSPFPDNGGVYLCDAPNRGIPVSIRAALTPRRTVEFLARLQFANIASGDHHFGAGPIEPGKSGRVRHRAVSLRGD